jgi:hypothetical protein
MGAVKPARRKQTNAILGDGTCSLCGGVLMLVTTRRVRRGAAWLNPLWDPQVKMHETCLTCRARREIYETDDSQ